MSSPPRQPRDPERFATKRSTLLWLSEAHGSNYAEQDVHRIAYDPAEGWLYVQWNRYGVIEQFETESVYGECRDELSWIPAGARELAPEDQAHEENEEQEQEQEQERSG